MDNPEEYTAQADQMFSVSTGFHSKSVVWVEIDDNDRKSVVKVRVLTAGRDTRVSTSSWIGLTPWTYRHLITGRCPTTPSKTLPPRLRPVNQHRLDEFERIRRELETQRAYDAAVGSSDAVDENADVTIAVPDMAAEATVATHGAADENA
eukprot:5860725-Pleurochrysis_carterae.AAC.1